MLHQVYGLRVPSLCCCSPEAPPPHMDSIRKSKRLIYLQKYCGRCVLCCPGIAGWGNQPSIKIESACACPSSRLLAAMMQQRKYAAPPTIQAVGEGMLLCPATASAETPP